MPRVRVWLPRTTGSDVLTPADRVDTAAPSGPTCVGRAETYPRSAGSNSRGSFPRASAPRPARTTLRWLRLLPRPLRDQGRVHLATQDRTHPHTPLPNFRTWVA